MTRIGAAARLLIWGAVFALVLGPQLVTLRFGLRSGEVPAAMHRLFLRLFGVRLVVHGAPPKAGTAALILANHISWLDIPVLGSLAPLSFVAKSEVARWPVLGFLATLQRTVFIDRSRKTHTAAVNTAMAERLGAGEMVLLFAEGTTGDGTRLLPFRASLVGAARAALAQGDLDRVLLQPLTIAYTRRNGLPVTRAERPDLAWYGDMDLGPHVATFLAKGPVDVRIVWGEPILFDRSGDRKRATAQAEATVRDALREAVLGRAPLPQAEPAAPDGPILKAARRA